MSMLHVLHRESYVPYANSYKPRYISKQYVYVMISIICKLKKIRKNIFIPVEILNDFNEVRSSCFLLFSSAF